VKAVNRKPMIRPEGTLTIQGGRRSVNKKEGRVLGLQKKRKRNSGIRRTMARAAVMTIER
jgi:hypothetical protein